VGIGCAHAVSETGSFSVETGLEEEGSADLAKQSRRVRVDPTLNALAVDTAVEQARPLRLGRYRLVRPLGRGGMGVVWRAWDPELRRNVAVKVIRTDRRKRKSARRLTVRLAREARALAQLSHPNVVPVYDVGIEARTVFIAMAFIEGETLRRWLATSTRTVAEIVDVFVGAAQGLAAAHAAGIVHRDFKPGNVLITEQGRAYVADFGLARADRGESHDEAATDSAGDSRPAADESACGALLDTLTDHNAALGTLPYMAPEQQLGRSLDERADQYGFCVSLYEALYGKRPFRGPNAQALLARKIRNRVPLLPPDRRVPRWLHRIITRGLAPRARDRFDSMRELIAALEQGRARGDGRPWIRWGAVAAASTGLVASLAVMASGPGNPCTTASVDETWGHETERTIRDRLAGTGMAVANDTADRVVSRVDAYVERWAETDRRVCLDEADDNDARVDDLEASATPSPRRACLEVQHQQLVGVVEALRTPDESVVVHAVDAIDRLPDPHDCLGAVVSSQRDADGTELRLRGDLARARGRGDAGQLEVALQRVVALQSNAEELGRYPVLAETLLTRGRLEHALAWHATAERTLTEAFWLAREYRFDVVAHDAAIALVEVVGHARARPEAGLEWIRQADETSRPSANSDDRRLSRGLALGRLYARWRRADLAFDALTSSMSACSDVARSGVANADCATAKTLVGEQLTALGRFEDARDVLDQARRAHQKRLGPAHPTVASDLVALARVDRVAGRPADAVAKLAQALDIRRHNFESGFGVADVEHQLGLASESLGEHDQAQRYLDAARTTAERSADDAPLATIAVAAQRVVPILADLGRVGIARGELTRAAGYLRRGATLLTEHRGRDVAALRPFEAGLGLIALRLGDLGDAREHLERAIRLALLDQGVPDTEVAELELGLAEVELADGNPERAESHASEALRIEEDALGTEAPELVLTLRVLSQAQRAAGHSRDAADSQRRAEALRLARY